MTKATRRLRELARRGAEVCVATAGPSAILLTSSAAEDESDFWSDLDLIPHWDALRSDESLADASRRLGAAEAIPRGPRSGDGVAETLTIDGIPCQCAHTAIAAWERDLTNVIEGLDVTSPTHTAIQGLLKGISLHGAALIDRWKERAAAFPDALAHAMVRHSLALFPIWYVSERLASRDATIWHYQIMAESAFNILGALAGLNRLYFSTFQFKRTRRFVEKVRVAPSDLADRLDGSFTLDHEAAAVALEALVREVADVVDVDMPAVWTSGVRRMLGKREQTWSLASVTKRHPVFSPEV